MALTYLLIICAPKLYSQNLTLNNYDSNTGLAVSDVHVIIINSSIASTSDHNCNVVFAWDKIAGAELLISHLTYELQIIQLGLSNPVEQNIFIDEKSMELDEVTVASKMADVKAARMKIFKSDVFEQKDGLPELWDNCSAKKEDICSSRSQILFHKNSYLINIFIIFQ